MCVCVCAVFRGAYAPASLMHFSSAGSSEALPTGPRQHVRVGRKPRGVELQRKAQELPPGPRADRGRSGEILPQADEGPRLGRSAARRPSCARHAVDTAPRPRQAALVDGARMTQCPTSGRACLASFTRGGTPGPHARAAPELERRPSGAAAAPHAARAARGRRLSCARAAPSTCGGGEVPTRQCAEGSVWRSNASYLVRANAGGDLVLTLVPVFLLSRKTV